MKTTTVGIDLAKNVFQIHGIYERGTVMLRKQLRRDQMAALFANLAVRDRSEAYGMCLSLGDKGAHVQGAGLGPLIPLFELLESRDFTVLLVNARHAKNVSGSKSVVLYCQWLQELMSYGLLSVAFRSAEQVCVLRSLWRQLGILLRNQARDMQHMQKALTR